MSVPLLLVCHASERLVVIPVPFGLPWNDLLSTGSVFIKGDGSLMWHEWVAERRTTGGASTEESRLLFIGSTGAPGLHHLV